MPEFTPNNVWGQKPVDDTTELTVPSGQTCTARRIGLDALMEAGILGEADTLTGIVDRKHVRRVRGANGVADHDEMDASSIMKDPEALKAIMTLADKAVPHIVVEPKVLCHWDDNGESIPDAQRVEGAIYTDMIGFEDKMFLFDFGVGGSSDVARFRERSEAALASVADVQAVPVPSVGTGRPRKRKKQ